MRKIADKQERKYRIDQFNYYSRRFNWPYCLQKQKDGKWVLLNRNYKPLNVYTSKLIDVKCEYICVDDHVDWIEYAPFAIELPKMNDEIAHKLSWNYYNGNGHIHMYNDGCKPEVKSSYRRAYIKKLEILADLVRKEGDERTWREIFNGEPEIPYYKCQPYKKSA